MTTEQEVYQALSDVLQPSYKKSYGIERAKNVMNVSSLVSGAKSYLYHFRYEHELKTEPRKVNLALLNGSALHAYICKQLRDWDKHLLDWNLPFAWKDGTEGIRLVAHYDNLFMVNSELILLEHKSTKQEDIATNGLLTRARRQVGAYREILRLKHGISYQAFIVIFNSEMTVKEVTSEQIIEGWQFVKHTAFDVAKELDK